MGFRLGNVCTTCAQLVEWNQLHEIMYGSYGFMGCHYGFSHRWKIQQMADGLRCVDDVLTLMHRALYEGLLTGECGTV